MDLVIMIYHQSDLNEDVEGERRGFGLVPLSPSSALRAPSPSREKVLLRFLEKVDPATPGKPCVQNDMGVGWEWKKNSLFEYTATKRHEKICSCSILSIWINQKSMLVASINNQYTQSQQLLRRASISMCRASLSNTQSVNIQWTQN